MATFTIVTSSTDMNIPTIRTSRDTTHDAAGACSPPGPGTGGGAAACGSLVRAVEVVRVMGVIVT
ncbi:hypothetical protein GCM10023320_54080 [Pseudonocardia adelaidensis]|uniref:Uncharacterized protein n=1 Tax=Pseudonocardia adelaidensis TaxID=648754 RepID=A0ABP9NQG5_9PSEU